MALTSVLCLSTVFSTPVIAAEDPAVESEIRYNMEIQSNTWENWPTGPQVYAEAAIVMEAVPEQSFTVKISISRCILPASPNS